MPGLVGANWSHALRVAPDEGARFAHLLVQCLPAEASAAPSAADEAAPGEGEGEVDMLPPPPPPPLSSELQLVAAALLSQFGSEAGAEEGRLEPVRQKEPPAGGKVLGRHTPEGQPRTRSHAATGQLESSTDGCVTSLSRHLDELELTGSREAETATRPVPTV